MSEPRRKIAWVDEKCRAWGRVRRQIDKGPFPQPKSMSGRVMEEGLMGAAIRGGSMDPLEVMVGDALDVSCAIVFAMMPGKRREGRMTDRQYRALYLHYVVRGYTQVEKAASMGVGPPRAYRLMVSAQHAIMPYLGMSASERAREIIIGEGGNKLPVYVV